VSSTGDGLERLLSAVFQGDDPAPELLARYVRDPNSLAPEARREIERVLAARPDLADEVRTLRSFRMPDVADAPAARPRVRSRWRLPVLAGAAAAAALLAVTLTPPGQQWLAGSGSGTPAGPGLDQPTAALTTEPAQTEIAMPAKPVEPQEQAQAAAPTPSPAPQELAEAPVPAPSPVEQLAEAPAPSPSPVAPTPEEPPKVALRESTPAASPVAPGPIAMLEPSYSRPPEALDRHRMVVAMRGPTPGGVALEALAPEHVAITGSAAPDLFWKLSGRLPESAKLLFRILEERSGEALVETELPLPAADGVQRVRLADQGATLAPDVIYTWFVVLRADPENPARDQLAQGWIARRAADVARTEPGAEPAELARAGLWYDALAAALELRSQQPSNESVERGVRALLAQGGLSVEP
jgi:hypothetical protein